jgi:hypothetical protein
LQICNRFRAKKRKHYKILSDLAKVTKYGIDLSASKTPDRPYLEAPAKKQK